MDTTMNRQQVRHALRRIRHGAETVADAIDALRLGGFATFNEKAAMKMALNSIHALEISMSKEVHKAEDHSQ